MRSCEVVSEDQREQRLVGFGLATSVGARLGKEGGGGVREISWKGEENNCQETKDLERLQGPQESAKGGSKALLDAPKACQTFAST